MQFASGLPRPDRSQLAAANEAFERTLDQISERLEGREPEPTSDVLLEKIRKLHCATRSEPAFQAPCTSAFRPPYSLDGWRKLSGIRRRRTKTSGGPAAVGQRLAGCVQAGSKTVGRQPSRAGRSPSHVEAVADLRLFCGADVLHNVPDLPRALERDWQAAVHLRVVPVHFSQAENLLA